jgi:succinoglycan biosynthesis transport protein ExoP
MTNATNSTIGAAGEDRNSQPTPRTDILSIVRRRMFTFIAVAAVVYVVVLAALFVIPVKYLATSSIIVAEQTASPDGTQPIGADKLGDPADLESQILLVKAPRLLRLVVERPDVQAALVPGCQPGGADASACPTTPKVQDKLIDEMQQHYAIAAVGRSRVITIGYDSGSPLIAQTLSNALTITFLNDRREAWVDSSQNSALSLKKDQQELSQSLKADEDQIRAFRAKNGLIRGSIAPIGSERLSSMSQSLVAAEAAKADAAAKMDEVEKAAKGNVTDSPTVMANHTISDLRQQLTLLDIEYARSSAILGPRHPSIVSLEQAREQLKARINTELQAVVNGARKTYETASDLVQGLRQKMHSFQTDAESAEDQEASLADLIRRVDAKRVKYDDLSKQITRLETQAPAYSDSTRLVSLAELPTSAYFPKRPPFILGGLILALMLGGGAAIVMDRIRGGAATASVPRYAPSTPAPAVSAVPSIAATAPKRPAASAPTAGVPVLCEMPFLGPKPSGFFGSLMGRSGTMSQDDVLRLARDNLPFRRAISELMSVLPPNGRAGGARIIAITSPRPGEGRTVTTIALAYALAASGRKTLIVEGDMQDPKIADILKLGKSAGLAGLLRDKLPIEAAVLPTAAPTLFVLPAGQRLANAARAMARPKMAELLGWTRRFDYVLIDAPALSAGKEASLVVGMSDAVICCTRSETASKVISAALRDITHAGGTLLGTVTTMVDPTSLSPRTARTPTTAPYTRPAGGVRA